jgi:predicted enzyme related to lactoylglutathione lyase
MNHPVVHFEIGCRDRAATSQFYRDLFDWSITDGDIASEIAAALPDGIPGHIVALGHEPFSYTMVYVRVSDIAATLKKAEALGGTILVPPVPIPSGTFAWFADMEGRQVGLIQPKT